MRRAQALIIRPLATMLTAACSIAAAILAAHIPPLVASGANLTDPAQADYARNFWAHTAPAVAAVGAICPLVVMSAVWPPVAGHINALLALCILGFVTASVLALEGLRAYRQPTIPVNGKVTSFQGREISPMRLSQSPPPHF